MRTGRKPAAGEPPQARRLRQLGAERGEATRRAHALRQVRVADPGRHRRPPQRQLDGQRRLAGAVHERDEVVEHPLLVGELEPQATADGQVVLDVLLERGHAAAPGHGWTMVASARRSTLA